MKELASASKLMLYSQSGTIVKYDKRFICTFDFTCTPLMKIPLDKGSTMAVCNYPCQVNTLIMEKCIAVNPFVHLTQFPSNENYCK